MGNSSVLSQTLILYRKIRRIAIREKCWKFIIFAVIISLLIAFVVSEKMFKDYDSTLKGFFTIASAAIWIGIFNSIQSICKEHKIIREEFRAGTKITAYITANALWQMVLCLIQSLVLMIICVSPLHYPKHGLVIPSAFVEYFITIFLIMYGADLMGIMISSIAGNSTTAMTIMPFVLLLQLVMCGVLFELKGGSNTISYFTFSKWGMSAFGSNARLNDDLINLFKIGDLHKPEYHPILDCYKDNESNVIKAWFACIGIGLSCYFTSILSLKIKNRDS